MANHSFAVMAYGDSPFLPACLDSLKSQSVASEIYITTSTDSAYLRGLAKKYGIPLYVTESGKGIAHDWNFALRKATTKYVTLAHQDDIYLSEYTASCVAAAEKFPDTQICFTDYAEIAGDQIRTNTLLLLLKRTIIRCVMPFKSSLERKFFKKMLLAFGCPIPAPSVTYNMEMLKQFSFQAEFSINMDWDAWYRLSFEKGKFVYVRMKSILHRIHPGSATTAGLKNRERQTEDIRMFRRFWPGLLASIIAKFYSLSYRSNAKIP